MEREEALKWIKANFPRLCREGKLEKVMHKYFRTYAIPDTDRTVRREEETTAEALKILAEPLV